MFGLVHSSSRVWRVIALVSASFLTALGGPLAKAASIVSDFSTASNPNGVWSYYYGTGPTTQTAYTASQGLASCFSIGPCWYNGGSIPDAVTMLQNTTGAPQSLEGSIVVPTGALLLDPEEYSVAVVYTAPASNTYDITGSFLGIDRNQNSHPVEILENGAIIYSNTISSYGQDDSFNFSEYVAAGDTISFEVGTGSSGCTYCYLSTGLDGTITAATPTSVAPEPSGFGFLIVGVAVLAGAWRAIPGFIRQRGSSR